MRKILFILFTCYLLSSCVSGNVIARDGNLLTVYDDVTDKTYIEHKDIPQYGNTLAYNLGSGHLSCIIDVNSKSFRLCAVKRDNRWIFTKKIIFVGDNGRAEYAIIRKDVVENASIVSERCYKYLTKSELEELKNIMQSKKLKIYFVGERREDCKVKESIKSAFIEMIDKYESL